jgi:hypothetical protein
MGASGVLFGFLFPSSPIFARWLNLIVIEEIYSCDFPAGRVLFALS